MALATPVGADGSWSASAPCSRAAGLLGAACGSGAASDSAAEGSRRREGPLSSKSSSSFLLAAKNKNEYAPSERGKCVRHLRSDDLSRYFLFPS